MTDFVNFPVDKLTNRQNYFSRIETLERRTGARSSSAVGQLSQLGQNTGDLSVDGSIVVTNRTDGVADVTINDIGIVIRNQEGQIYFENTISNEYAVGMYIDAGNFLVLQNQTGSGGIGFDIDDASHNVNQHYIDYNGMHLDDGATYYFGVNDAKIEEGWFPTTDTITRTGTHAFSVTGNRTTMFRFGSKFRYVDVATAEYGVIMDVNYVTTDNTTNVTLIPNTDYSMSTDAISGPMVSYIESPANFPGYFNFDPAPQGFSVLPSSTFYAWTTTGTTITVFYIETVAGTSNDTIFTASLPVDPSHATSFPLGATVNNSVTLTTPGRAQLNAGSTTVTFRSDSATGAWTAANGKRANVTMTYKF